MFTLRLGLALAILAGWTAGVCGQPAIQSGAVRMTLPSTNWAPVPVPAMATKVTRADSPRLLMQAEIKDKLQLRVRALDYPAKLDGQKLATFVEKLRLNYQRDALGIIEDKSGWAGKFGFVEFGARLPGSNWIGARAFFGEKHAYVAEIEGNIAYGPQSNACWERITFVGESPLNTAIVNKMVDMRAATRKAVEPYVVPHPSPGWRALEAFGVVTLSIGIASAWRAWRKRQTRSGHTP